MKFIRDIFVTTVLVTAALASAHASEDKMGVIARHPAVSPNGSQVIFSADFDGATHLWVTGLDGSNLHKITPFANGFKSLGENEPSWSPNGQQIAYTTFDGFNTDVWVMRVDGAYPVRLTANAGNNTHPVWSPDSSRIAFVSDRSGTKDLWIMNRDGTAQRKILNSDAEENDPSFSPTGDKIVFSRSTDDAASLMTVNLDGTGLAALTSGAYEDWEPSWGPQGIVFTSNRDGSGQWKLWKVQPNGGALTKIQDQPGHDPSWLRDGSILFIDEMTPSKALTSITVLNPSTGAKRVVVDVQGFMIPIDIRPGKSSNSVNPASRGKIQVSILSTPKFDASKSVAQSTLTFGRGGSEPTLYDCSKSFRDVNRDGAPDLTCRFWLRGAGFKSDSTVGVLRFNDTNGVPYEGRDAITIVPTDDPDDLKD